MKGRMVMDIYTPISICFGAVTSCTGSVWGSRLKLRQKAPSFDYFGNRFARAWWEETKFKYEQPLIDAVEAAMQTVSPDQDIEFFARISDRLSAGDGANP